LPKRRFWGLLRRKLLGCVCFENGLQGAILATRKIVRLGYGHISVL
jgi:hypothetical protein